MNNELLDEILKQALTPADEPDIWLNQRIINQARETEKMKKINYRKIAAIVLSTVLMIGIGSATVYAAWQYLSPEKVSEKMYDDKLAKAFQGEDAVIINETQSYGGYDVTLLGIVSGENLSEFETTVNGHILQDRTYTVTAIQKSDGTPMPKISEDAYGELSFLVSPFIKGYDPNWYNAVTMYGGYHDLTIDGILYRLTECDNVELFADCGLYLGVMDTTFYNRNAYQYEDSTGKMIRNEEYEGLNALFELPVDEEKADPKAAKEYLEALQLRYETDDEGLEDKETDIDKWIKEITPENIDEKAVCLESTIQVLTPDEKGMISYEYELDEGGGGECTLSVKFIFDENEYGMSENFSYNHSGDLESLKIETFTRNEDGTITFAVYVPK